MSTERKSQTPRIGLTTFWGGDVNGCSIQVTEHDAYTNERTALWISLSQAEAFSLSKDLLAFAKKGPDGLCEKTD